MSWDILLQKQSFIAILLMVEIRRSPVEGTVVYRIIHRVSYIPGGARFQPSTDKWIEITISQSNFNLTELCLT